MKVFLFIIFTCPLFAPADWLTDFDEALLQAKRENKNVLLSFSGSDWCAPCIQMKKEVFEKEEFKVYASEHLILVKADFPRQKRNQLEPNQKMHNEKLAEQYNPKGKFPLTLLLDGEGHVIREWDGFQGLSTGEFIQQVKTAGDAK